MKKEKKVERANNLLNKLKVNQHYFSKTRNGNENENEPVQGKMKNGKKLKL